MLEVTKYNTYMHAFFFLIINIHTNIQPMTHTSYMHKQGYSINFFFFFKKQIKWNGMGADSNNLNVTKSI